MSEATQYCLQIGSIEMCNDLENLGYFKKKTNNLSLPNMPSQYFSDFVRGYFDGDGNVWSGIIHKGRKTWSLAIQTAFTSCSSSFLEDLNRRLQIIGINKGAIYNKQGRYFRLVYSTNGSLKLYYFMYNNKVKGHNDAFLKRKKKVFESFIKERQCGRGVAWLTQSPVTG